MTTDYVTVWQEAARSGDATATRAALADEVVLVSPLTDTFEFRGRDEVVELMHSVFRVLTEITFTRRIEQDNEVVLVAQGKVRGRRLGETQLLTLDASGRIARIELFMRPLPAVTALLRGLGNAVPDRQGRPVVRTVLTLAGGMLDTVAGSGDKVFLPMAAPRRP